MEARMSPASLQSRTTSAAPGRPGPSARERLLSAALARFGADSPVAVSLEDIRQEAGVSVGALYHHFADKAALLDALYVELTQQFQAGFLAELRAHPGAEDGIQAGVRFYLRWVSRHRAAASILLGHRPDAPALHDHNRRFFAEVMAWWQTHVHYGALRSLRIDVIHALWLGPAQEYTRHWLAGHAKRTPATVVDTLSEAAWNALKEPT
jgi:AcrR family transcriptional regulator